MLLFGLLLLMPVFSAGRPNIVIFFTDDQGTLDVNCYGSKDLYTPNMDKLAARGARFTQAYAHVVCCPSRAMLMTGRHPQRSGIINWTQGNAQGPKGRNMPLEEVTLAEALKGAGYKTALFGKWHLGAHPEYGPTKQGFDEFFGLRGGFIDNYNHHFLHGRGFYDLYEKAESVHRKGQYFPDLMTARAIKYIDANAGTPFFMYVAFNIPHYPEQADPKFDERYADLKEPRRSYAKVVSTTDDRMGLIMNHLEKKGLRDNTILIFMSDNGHSAEDIKIRVTDHLTGLPKGANYGANGGGGNTGKWLGHKATFQEGGIRVPAMISYPGTVPQGVVRNQAITAMDWMPTVLELCGVDASGLKLDGASILPLIQSGEVQSHNQVMHWGWRSGWAVREGDWKLRGNGDKAEFLGRLSGENPEAKNYLEEKPELVSKMLKMHLEWHQKVTR